MSKSITLRSSIAIVMLVLAAFACNSADAQTPWRWKFSAGEVLRYDIQQNSQTETKGAGKLSSATVKMNMRLAWKVEKVVSGIATISQKIEKLSSSMQIDKSEPVIYDSTAKTATSSPAKVIAESVEPILAATYFVQISPRGEVLSLERNAAAAQTSETKSENFPPDGILRVAQLSSLVMPEEAVSPGASWEKVIEIPSNIGQPLKHTNRYTYSGPAERNGKSCEKIDFETQFNMEKRAPDLSAKDHEQAGSLWFDAMAGRLVASESKLTLVTERPYREMIIRVQSTTTTNATLVE
jgi:hypothetical protein